ncbi:MAG TPA: CPBP family glutamic-type intramembrane protease, partial [Rhodothermales bacterium]|nr:CPBP family glutamic-type intramembrane protease [Rhodothermales bacterium]
DAQALPLSLIGIYLCWLTWKTGSILPAVVVHFVNNGFSVVMATALMNQKGFDPSKLEQLPLPWYGILPLVLVGLIGFRYVMHRIRANPPSYENAPASVL